MTKYGFAIDSQVVAYNINRLTNQLWKLIPMKENNENWLRQLDSVIIEIAGLNEMLMVNNKYLVLLSKLEGLKQYPDIDFIIYRRTIFESISLLREIGKDE